MSIPADQITGLVVCGGRGTRMGGADKGLQNFNGMPLALHALMRLSPQVGHLMINANRNLAAYESLGAPVWPDPVGDFAGPLAGWQAGLERCETPFLVVVPCDSPHFPTNLVPRLAEALVREDADIAMACTQEDGRVQPQPVFTLLKSMLLEDLVAFLQAGERKIDRWTAMHPCARVLFDDSAAFANANTLEELHRLQTPQG